MNSGMSETVLVTGATGGQGRAVVAALLADGWNVRALTRDPDGAAAQELAAAGAVPVGGSLDDVASLRAAMDGADVLYGITTPFSGGAEAEVAQGRNLIAAAQAAELPWFVLASVASALDGTGIPHFESKAVVERALHDSGIDHLIVAPTWFYENVGSPAAVRERGELALALPPQRRLQQVALRDFGAVVAALLARRASMPGARIEVAGDEPTAAGMAKALGVPYREEALEEVAQRSADLGAMYRFLAAGGYRVDLVDLRALLEEVRWTSFAAWAAGA